MSDWRTPFRSAGTQQGLVHPHARAAGAGPAAPRVTEPVYESTPLPHPGSPAARSFDWLSLPHFDLDDRAKAVLEAIQVARRHAPDAIFRATGEQLGAILEGIIPGLLVCLCVVAATTAIGGLAGAAIGALAGGVGAVPGAVAGAGVGFDAGIALLELLGLSFLVIAIGKSLIEATRLSVAAVTEAWESVDDPRSRWYHVDHAGRMLADALGTLMRGILEGLVAFLLAKGTSAAASRVPELVAKLRSSRLGEGFAVWIERNWQSLLKNERFKPRPQASTGPASGGAGSGAPAPRPPVAKSGALAPRTDPKPTAGPRPTVGARPEPHSSPPQPEQVGGPSPESGSAANEARAKPPTAATTVRGKASGRPFNPEKAGGPIEKLDYRNATITKEGVADVRTHTGRFETFEGNDKMVDRLDRIANGELQPTAYDQRYYTHELRELERYRNLGIPDGVDPGYEVWNDAHTATLEDFGIAERDANGLSTLYHPDAL